MMDCAHCRRLLLADPGDRTPALTEHLASCPECKPYSERLLRFDARVRKALGVDMAAAVQKAALPQPPPDGPRAAPTRAAPISAGSYRKPRLAMAASVLVALMVGGALWLGAPGQGLAADVVAHMAEEPSAWRRTDVPVPPPALREVLRDAHVQLGAGSGLVSYAHSCSFRGHTVPHFVVQTSAGPVTVMVLVHERVFKSVRFDEQGYRGVIVPADGHGSVAVLTRGGGTDMKTIEGVAGRLLDSIVWTS